ncbi:MAG: hypothetical protein QXE81_02565 [Desulfurococcaceae archaeon]
MELAILEVSGTKCEICELNNASRTCRICNRRVCDEDYDYNIDACIGCRETLCKICGNYLSIGVCKYCGRQGCEDCLIQISLVEYACMECYRGLRSNVFENR